MHAPARPLPLALLALLALLAAACGKDDPKPSTPAAPPASPPAVGTAPGAAASAGDPKVSGSRFLLATEPASAVSVLDAKGKGEAKGVTLVGRVKETVHGFAAFSLTDLSLAYCGADKKEDGCPTPWDYCCIADDKVAQATIAVAAREKGEVVEAALPELRNLDVVVVHGDVVKAKDGSLRLDADGWFRKERPSLPSWIEFPK